MWKSIQTKSIFSSSSKSIKGLQTDYFQSPLLQVSKTLYDDDDDGDDDDDDHDDNNDDDVE